MDINIYKLINNFKRIYKKNITVFLIWNEKKPLVDVIKFLEIRTLINKSCDT